MAQSKDVRLVTESKLDVSNAGLKAGVAADLAPIKNDVADLKVMGGLNPGSPNDASTSNFIETPGTLTHTALSAAIADSLGIGGNGSGVVFGIDPDGTPVLVIANSTIPPAAQVAGLVATAGVASASLTWAAPSGSGDAITDFSIQYRVVGGPTWITWDHAPSTALAATVTGLTNYSAYEFRVAAVNLVGPGAYSTTATATPVGEAVSGVVVTDTFTRTAADLVGSTADSGQVWSGTAGRIKVNGTRAESLGTGPHAALIDYGVRGNATMTLTARVPSDGTTGDCDMYILYIDVNNYLSVSLDSRASAVNVSVFVRTGGGPRSLISFPANTIPFTGTPADYSVQIGIVGLTVTVIVNGVTRTLDILQAEADALKTAHLAGFAGQHIAHQWDNLTISATGTRA